ncbi:hypothetical protein NE398_20920 [Clostridium tertium]|jgi:hypothetical protein|uniref:Uncharacterized protein n=1 Tax=Clostridium tertium TaxID=1559 RepID=A0A9X4B241_9CLOT|nr:hypothetical protein [Clostridium tertium]MDC4242589.1 hypothetical protein [Clostridium tertium]
MGLILDIVNNVVPKVQERVSKGEGLKKVLYEELEKEIAQSLTDQDKRIEPNTKTTTDIIPLGTDIDNGDIYNLETGQTLREL